MIAVLGAHGTTGTRVVHALEKRGLPVRALGRGDVDVTDAAAVRRVATEADVVVSCAGPYATLGPDAARATIAAGTHWLDVTGEQPFAWWCREHLDAAARDGGVVVGNAIGLEVLPADVIAALLCDGPVSRLDFVNVARGLTASPGSKRSALAVAGSVTHVWKDRAWTPRPAGGGVRRLDRARYGVGAAIWIPGVEQLTVPLHCDVETIGTWWGMPAPAAAAIRFGSPWVRAIRPLLPTLDGRLGTKRPKDTGQATFAIHGMTDRSHATVTGSDAYDTTGRIVAWVAEELIQRGPFANRGGVLAPAQIIDPRRFRSAAPALGLEWT